jgi:SAM-dependent methyltransferase
VSSDREALRVVFDQDALLYDKARPHYPEIVFDTLDTVMVEARRQQPALGHRALEIGCGTGQATVPLAARGYDVLAIELGPGLAEVARANLAGISNAEVITGDVEQWNGPAGAFDLVLCATAFHWLDPDTRLTRVARLLRAGGVIALIQTMHVAGPSDEAFAAIQRCYEQWDPATSPGLRLQRLDELPPTGSYDLEDATEFTDVALHRFPVDHDYTAETYLELLSTFSGHRALEPDRRKGLYGCVRALIEAQPGATITRSSAFELATATRRPGLDDAT